MGKLRDGKQGERSRLDRNGKKDFRLVYIGYRCHKKPHTRT